MSNGNVVTKPYMSGEPSEFSVRVLVVGDECEALDYLGNIQESAARKFEAAFKNTCKGEVNEARFKFLTSDACKGVFEFKVEDRGKVLRMYGFREGGSLVLTHGSPKRKPKGVKSECRKVQNFKKQLKMSREARGI